MAALFADADTVPEGTSGAPRDWHRALPIPHPQWSSGLASPRLPWAPVSARIKGARAGWRALARRALCPALPGPPTGSPRAPQCGPGCELGSGAGLARPHPTLSRCQAGGDRPRALSCVSHMWGWGLVWGRVGFTLLCTCTCGAASRDQVALKAPRKCSATQKLGGDSSARAGDTSWGCSQFREKLMDSSGRENEQAGG